jgi:hypothetical protein
MCYVCLEFQTMDEVQKHTNSDHTPHSLVILPLWPYSIHIDSIIKQWTMNYKKNAMILIHPSDISAWMCEQNMVTTRSYSSHVISLVPSHMLGNSWREWYILLPCRLFLHYLHSEVLFMEDITFLSYQWFDLFHQLKYWGTHVINLLFILIVA